MKIFKNHRIIVVLLLFITIVSCKKETNDISNGENTSIIFTINGVNNNHTNKLASSITPFLPQEKSIETTSFKNIDMDISASSGAISDITNDKNNKKNWLQQKK